MLIMLAVDYTSKSDKFAKFNSANVSYAKIKTTKIEPSRLFMGIDAITFINYILEILTEILIEHFFVIFQK